MRTIAERLIFREATAAEFRVLDCVREIAIGIDKFDCAGDADGSAFWVYESLDRIYWLAL